MNTTLIIVVVVLALVAILFGLRGGGPRVTTIEHRRDETDKPEDQD